VWLGLTLQDTLGNFFIVPNSVLSKDTIINYSEPTLETRLELEVGVSYDAAPNRVTSTRPRRDQGRPAHLARRASRDTAGGFRGVVDVRAVVG